MLADFRRSHEMNIGAALRLLQPTDIGAESQFKRASEAVATFDAPVIYSMSLLAIEDAIESQPAPFWDRALGQWLRDGKTRVVYQVIRSRLTFIFRGAGGRGLNLRAVLGPLGGLGPRRAVALAQRGNDRVEAGAGGGGVVGPQTNI